MMPKSMFKLATTMLIRMAILSPLSSFAQDSARNVPDFIFGQVQPGDFRISSPVVDSNTDAVILADVGSAALEGRRGEVILRLTRLRRILIISQRGLEASKMSIGFSSEENGSGKLESLKAAVYNLENGVLKKTDLADKDIFLDHHTGSYIVEKFAFPDLKVGSIVEYTYSVLSSSIATLYPWDFQGGYPRLWSDYTVSIPDLYNYVFLVQGNNPLYFKSVDSAVKYFHYAEASLDTKIHTVRWVMKDVPAFREEPFTSTLDNYIAAVRFQLSQRPRNTYARERVLDTWEIANNRLLSNEYFGAPIGVANHWLRSDLKQITEGCKNDLEKAKKIYEFVRDHFLVGSYGMFMDDPDALKDVFKKKKGGVSEINLLLVAMLRESGLQADPVILGTRSNGVTNAKYPIYENFNYVVVRSQIDNKIFFLDATQPLLGFGKLPLECYNGHARVVTRNGFAVYLQTDSIQESKMTTVFVTNDEKDSMYAVFAITPGYYGSLGIRESLAKTGLPAYFKGINALNPLGTILQNTGIDSIRSYADPVTIHYEMRFSPGDGDFLYINPMFNEGLKQNPFKSSTRLYPVEMPYAKDEMYVLNMEVPNGYKIDELPKSARIDLTEGSGRYEYSIQSSGNNIQFVSKLVLKKTFFLPEDYQTLRNFFADIVKKQGEIIIFKKIK
jgi:hypothetical protein